MVTVSASALRDIATGHRRAKERSYNIKGISQAEVPAHPDDLCAKDKQRDSERVHMYNLKAHEHISHATKSLILSSPKVVIY